MATRRSMRNEITLLVSLFVLSYNAVAAEIRSEDLNVTRSVMEGDWLRLRLEVLGLRLSYPAYRIDVKLTDDNTVSFNFWVSAPLASHLQEAGTGETERVLRYHAEGIAEQVMALLQEEFPELWPRFDPAEDFRGSFWEPGEEFDSLPQELGDWRRGRLDIR